LAQALGINGRVPAPFVCSCAMGATCTSRYCICGNLYPPVACPCGPGEDSNVVVNYTCLKLREQDDGHEESLNFADAHKSSWPACRGSPDTKASASSADIPAKSDISAASTREVSVGNMSEVQTPLAVVDQALREGREPGCRDCVKDDEDAETANLPRRVHPETGRQRTGESLSSTPSGLTLRRRASRSSGNANRPHDYKWLEATLESLAKNQAGTLGCVDIMSGKDFSPVFFVIGGCPNIFCGMQAVMYCANWECQVDFWWVKPGKAADGEGNFGIERNTLSRHAKGPHKNDPGRSRQFYKPLADLFSQECEHRDGSRFGIERVSSCSGGRALRAYMDKECEGRMTRLYMHLVWQEDWTSNPFARSKYIKGKLVYQKDLQAHQFFARQYSITNGKISVSDVEEQAFSSVLPGDDVKDLRE